MKASNSTPYCVDGTAGASCYLETAGVAGFDGTSERQVAVGTNCTSNGWNPYYLLTSLTVSTSGTRRLVQAEIAQTPQTYTSQGRLFATDTGSSPAPHEL